MPGGSKRKRKGLVWARDGDGTEEHPAYLLDDDGAPDVAWIEWASNGAVVQIPRSCIGSPLASRRSRSNAAERSGGGRSAVSRSSSAASSASRAAKVQPSDDGPNHASTSAAPSPVASEVMGRSRDSFYGYDIDSDNAPSSAPAAAPSPVLSISTKVKWEEEFDCGTDEEPDAARPVKGEEFDCDTDEENEEVALRPSPVQSAPVKSEEELPSEWSCGDMTKSICCGERAMVLPYKVENTCRGKKKKEKIKRLFMLHPDSNPHCKRECFSRTYNASADLDGGRARKQKKLFLQMGEAKQAQFLKALNLAAIVVRDRFGGVRSPVHDVRCESKLYCYPLQAHGDYGFAMLCDRCFAKAMGISPAKMQSLARQAREVPQTDMWRMVSEAHAHLAGRMTGPNVALVASRARMLGEYTNVYTFHNPRYIPPDDRNRPMGLIRYEPRIDIDDRHGHRQYLLRDETLDLEPGSAIVVPKSELLACKMKSQGKLDFIFDSIHGSGLDPNDEVVILVLVARIAQDVMLLDPNEEDAELVKRVKYNIVTEGKHHGSRGYIAGNGEGSPFDSDLIAPFRYLPNACPEDIARYELLHEDMRRFERQSIEALVDGFSITHHAALSHRRNQECAVKVNTLASRVGLDEEPINLQNLESDGVDLNFPNDMACLGASTQWIQNENDLGSTMVSAITQMEDDGVPEFLFVNIVDFEGDEVPKQLSESGCLSAKMNRGVVTFFNGLLVPHRQKKKMELDHKTFWNMACYCNRIFDQNSRNLAQKHLNMVLDNLDQLN